MLYQYLGDCWCVLLPVSVASSALSNLENSLARITVMTNSIWPNLIPLLTSYNHSSTYLSLTSAKSNSNFFWPIPIPFGHFQIKFQLSFIDFKLSSNYSWLIPNPVLIASNSHFIGLEIAHRSGIGLDLPIHCIDNSNFRIDPFPADWPIVFIPTMLAWSTQIL